MPSGVVEVKVVGSAPFSSLAASFSQSFRLWSAKSAKAIPSAVQQRPGDYSGRDYWKSRNAKGFARDLHHVHEAIDGGLVHHLGVTMNGGAGMVDHGLERGNRQFDHAAHALLVALGGRGLHPGQRASDDTMHFRDQPVEGAA